MVPLSSRNSVAFHFLTDGLPLFIAGGTPLFCSAVSGECRGGMNECRNLGQSMEDLLTHFHIQSSTFFGGMKQTVGIIWTQVSQACFEHLRHVCWQASKISSSTSERLLSVPLSTVPVSCSGKPWMFFDDHALWAWHYQLIISPLLVAYAVKGVGLISFCWHTFSFVVSTERVSHLIITEDAD
jgi:hypothetical protein